MITYFLASPTDPYNLFSTDAFSKVSPLIKLSYSKSLN